MKKYILGILVILFSTFLTAYSVWAADPDLDVATKQALDQTQEMLLNPDARAKAISGDANALRVDQQVKDFAKGDKAKEQQIYQIANDVFGKLVKDTGGDTQAIQAKLEAAMKNPESLKQDFTADQLAQIKAMAEQKK